VKYLILIYSNEAAWSALSDEQRASVGAGHTALTEEFADSGELIVSHGLADPSMGKRVSVHDGQTMTSDGPFAEAKEHLAGFYLIDCESIERAVEYAAKAPDAEFGTVEVRPVLVRNGSLDI
jgi:hypothetical protein